LQQIFNSYLNVPEEARDYHDVSSSLNYSKLCCAYEKTLFPKACGWLTEPGIYYCSIAPLADSPKFVDHAELIPYPKPMNESFYDSHTASVKSNAYVVDKNVPISFVLTDFHAILLFADRIKIVSLINYEVVKEDGVPNNEKFIDVVRDVNSGFVYVIGNKFIYRYAVSCSLALIPNLLLPFLVV
jgi:vacuolar protein sorting-associated protein 18